MKKTIVIIGGTGGIGNAAAVAFAKQGNDIIFQGRDTKKGKKIAKKLSGMNGPPLVRVCPPLSSAIVTRMLLSSRFEREIMLHPRQETRTSAHY